ncbi:MAG: RNA 3'-terminal phosphate cyclase [Candidatus Bathyarchaeota archaeon]|nr:RNA 3'-terminal phosphate cyclase [Candidatus Bathyarchaeota archaeon]
MIQIDGSMMEGGGQLLRMATSYSAILGEPITVYNIRAKRRDPGLKPQHLTTLRTAAEITNAETSGAEIGSQEITFTPEKIRGGEYDINIGTAGSISLLLQCINPILWYSDKPSKLTIKGGTAVNWSPPITFLQQVVYKAFHSMGVNTSINVKRHGFYPKGGGEVTQTTHPVKSLQPLRPKEPDIKKINGISLCGALPEHVAVRQANSAKKHLNQIRQKTSIKPIVADPPPLSPGSFVVLWCEGSDVYIGVDSLGARGKPSEVVGTEAASKLVNDLRTGSHVDKNTTDHLILPASLAEGGSMFRTSEITFHTLTAIKIAETFTDAKFKVSGRMGEPGTIWIKGIGYRRN